jgi:acylphosphatase
MPIMHVEVEGRVQGVGYRWFARQAAVRRGIHGWVMNRPDGCVEVVAKGPESKLAAFRSELRQGPPGAQVTEVRDLPEVPDDLREDFVVKR